MAWPAPFPGWLLEPGGDAWPRGMTVTPQGAQDPAYRPTPRFCARVGARRFVALLRGVSNLPAVRLHHGHHGLASHEGVLACLLAVSLRGRAACEPTGHQVHLGHPWPGFHKQPLRLECCLCAVRNCALRADPRLAPLRETNFRLNPDSAMARLSARFQPRAGQLPSNEIFWIQ